MHDIFLSFQVIQCFNSLKGGKSVKKPVKKSGNKGPLLSETVNTKGSRGETKVQKCKKLQMDEWMNEKVGIN